MRPLIASTPRTMRDSCRALVLDKAGESSSKSGRISGMGFRPPEVDEFALTTSIRKPYSLSSALTRFGEGIGQEKQHGTIRRPREASGCGRTVGICQADR